MSTTRLPAAYRHRTVPALLTARAALAPRRVAVVGPSSAGATRRTFAELAADAAAIARGLAERGIGRGDRVAWLLDNRSAVEALVLYHGIAAAGGVNVPVNTRLAPTEVATLLTHCDPALVVCGAEHRDRLDALPAGIDHVEVAAAGSGLAPLDATGTGTTTAEPAEDDPVVILYTSGTTGLPKGVVHTHGSAIAAGLGWADAFRLTVDDVVQSPFPVFAGAGLHFNGLACLWAGCTLAIDDGSVGDQLRRIGTLGTTVYAAVPSIYAFWLDHAGLPEAALRSLRLLDFGGAAMPPALIERLAVAVPSAGLVQTYGLTEAGPGGTYLPEEYARERLGSIGNRGSGRATEIRIVDEEGRDVGAGGEGELVLRGPSVMAGYFRDEEATAATFLDGWLRSGDIVRIDDEGFWYHVDRRKDLIIRGGFNIASVEVEAALAAHPAVAGAAVVGVPHPKLGEDVHAAVELRPGVVVGPEELLAHAASLLADFKRPRTLEIVDSLPRNAGGKVLKAQLRRGPA